MINSQFITLPDNIVITTLSRSSLLPAGLVTPASSAWPAANRAVFVPFRIGQPMIVDRLFVWAGGTQAGTNNVDLGIYDAYETLIVSTGSQTYNGGVNVYNSFNITDTTIGPGLFYLACALDTNTDTTFRVAMPTAAVGQAMGVTQQASAFPLPRLATFASFASTLIPIIGLTGRSFV